MADHDAGEEYSSQFKEKRKKLQKKAINILNGIYMAYKNIKIYDPDNLTVRQQISSVFQEIMDLLQTEEEVTFTLRLSTLYLNGLKVHFSFVNYHLFKFLSAELIKRETSLLQFSPGLGKEELKQLLLIFWKERRETGISYETFSSKLRDAQITRVSIEQALPFEETQSSERNAKKIFFLGIVHLKEMFDHIKKGKKIPLSTTRRLMQSIFNHIVNNESFTYGLTTIKNFDEYTLNHSINVCILSVALGKRLGLDRNELAELGISAFFHDFGKTEISKEILSKPSKLNEKEWEIIIKHPHLGAEKLIHLSQNSHLPVRAINVAMEHHVKEDLTGYPKYQKKRHVNLFSKIVRVCDVYDATTTKRPYRTKVFTRDECLNMMMERGGTDFDPIILKVFSNMVGVYPIGTLVLLNTGEIGIVVETNPEPSHFMRPKVKIIADADGNRVDGDIIDLSQRDQITKTLKRRIIKSLDPQKYNIQVSDYFLIQAQ